MADLDDLAFDSGPARAPAPPPPGAPIWPMAAAAVLLVVLAALWYFGTRDTAPAPAGFAPIAIGLALTLIHLISIPVTNTSVNPARSTGPALIVGGLALQQLWLFWLAPLAGGVVGGMLYRGLFDEAPAKPDIIGNDA